MKKTLLTITFLFFTLGAFAQRVGRTDITGRKDIKNIIFIKSTIVNSKKPEELVYLYAVLTGIPNEKPIQTDNLILDENGNPINFSNEVSGLNYLENFGWKLVTVENLPSQYVTNKYYYLHRD